MEDYEDDAAQIRQLSGKLNSDGLELTVSFMEYLISTGRYEPRDTRRLSLYGCPGAAGDIHLAARQEHPSGWQQ